MNFTTLLAALSQRGLKHRIIESGATGRIVLLGHGARVIGIFADASSDNAVWVNPALLDDQDFVDRFMAGGEWNSGGDRTWISPEIEYNIIDARKPGLITSRIQAAIDPGNYAVTGESEHHVVQEQTLSAVADDSSLQLDASISKSVSAIADPLLVLAGGQQLADSYRYCGFKTETTIVRNLDTQQTPVALWSLMQVPAGGEVLIPVYGDAQVHTFFGSRTAERLDVKNNCVHFAILGEEAQKISIKAVDLCGRIGYYRETSTDTAILIVRQFDTDPSAHYGDVFAPNFTDYGHCVQSYNDSGALGGFGELEYHTPMLAEGQNRLADSNQAWIYEASLDVIKQLASKLLGCSLQCRE